MILIVLTPTGEVFCTCPSLGIRVMFLDWGYGFWRERSQNLRATFITYEGYMLST